MLQNWSIYLYESISIIQQSLAPTKSVAVYQQSLRRAHRRFFEFFHRQKSTSIRISNLNVKLNIQELSSPIFPTFWSGVRPVELVQVTNRYFLNRSRSADNRVYVKRRLALVTNRLFLLNHFFFQSIMHIYLFGYMCMRRV